MKSVLAMKPLPLLITFVTGNPPAVGHCQWVVRSNTKAGKQAGRQAGALNRSDVCVSSQSVTWGKQGGSAWASKEAVKNFTQGLSLTAQEWGTFSTHVYGHACIFTTARRQDAFAPLPFKSSSGGSCVLLCPRSRAPCDHSIDPCCLLASPWFFSDPVS